MTKSTIEDQINRLLERDFSPKVLKVVNESYKHSVPEGSESHFNVTLVSDDFHAKKLIQRHRMMNQTLADLLKNSIHALALHTLTPEEWETRKEVLQSPECRGKG